MKMVLSAGHGATPSGEHAPTQTLPLNAVPGVGRSYPRHWTNGSAGACTAASRCGNTETAGAATRQVKARDTRNPRYNNARRLAAAEFIRKSSTVFAGMDIEKITQRVPDEILPAVTPTQNWCCSEGCGVTTPVMADFSYWEARDATTGKLLQRRAGKVWVSHCCGAEIDLYDDLACDFVKWQPENEAELK